MPDMLVKLYDLPDEAPALARSHAFGVEIRRAMAPDRQRVLAWVRTHSGACAAGVVGGERRDNIPQRQTDHEQQHNDPGHCFVHIDALLNDLMGKSH